MDNFRSKIAAAVLLVPAVVLGAAGVASAQAYDPTSDVTALGTSAASTMGPIVIALVTAVVGLAVAVWAGKAVLRLVRSGGRSVG